MKSPLKAIIWGLSLLLAGCSGEVENEYSTSRAFFRFSPVTAVPPLQQSLGNPGLYCRISFFNRTVTFTSSAGNSQQYILTDDYANRSIAFIAGFIVGTPSVPDLNGNFYQVAYDLVCPTCYDRDAIQRSLGFSADETATCGRCHHTYSLRHGGIIEGAEGDKLKRYHITYSNNVMVIQNN